MDTLAYVSYNSSNNDYAKENRQNPTRGEFLMWEKILKHRPLGFKFTRQKPLGSFIADFYCSKLLLVIEVDGCSHDDKEGYDAVRDNCLQKKGIKVIRYYNKDVIKNIGAIYESIEDEIQMRQEEINK